MKNLRQEEILKHLEANITAETSKLASVFGVSQITIRRDFQRLAELDLITIIHGGAMINKLPTFSSKRLNVENTGQEKREIAIRAAQFIEDGDTIILDAGSSVKNLAMELVDKKEITVITNSILVMNVLAQTNSNIRLIATPGLFRKSSMSFFGAATNKFLDKFRVDKAFIGVVGVSAEAGFTTTDTEEGNTKAKMIEIAEKSYVLADHSKIGLSYLYQIDSGENIDYLITGSKHPQDEIEELIKRDIQVVVPE